jgi:hypothetical protein
MRGSASHGNAHATWTDCCIPPAEQENDPSPSLSKGSTQLADDLDSAAPPGVPVNGHAADDVPAWDETEQRMRRQRRDDRFTRPSDSPVIEAAATLDTVGAYAGCHRACSEPAIQQRAVLSHSPTRFNLAPPAALLLVHQSSNGVATTGIGAEGASRLPASTTPPGRLLYA